MLPAFYWLFHYLRNNVAWDILLHARMLETFLEHDSFPVPPGYPFLTWLFSGFATRVVPILRGANVALALMTLLKLGVIFYALKACWKRTHDTLPEGRELLLLFGLSLSLMLVAPLYTFNGFFYFGRVALSIWHNPTTITVAPFALLLFLATPAFLEKPRQQGWKILVLALLNILIKPSFLFAWLPGVFLVALLTTRSWKTLLWITVPLFITGLMILGQYYLIYTQGTLDELIYGSRPSGVVIKPLLVWNHFLEKGNTSLWISLATSLAFPLLFVGLFVRTGKINLLTWIGVSVLVMGLLISGIFAEGEARTLHGNFLWTAYLANFSLFIAAFLNLMEIKPLSWKQWVLYLVVALHVLSGIGFLVNTMIIKNYL